MVQALLGDYRAAPGGARCHRTVRDGVRPAVSDHDYLSTACFHAEHERCRRSCKFCSAQCRCHCHDSDLSNQQEGAIECATS